MIKKLQTELFPLRTPTFAVGGTDVVPLDVIPATGPDGLITHVLGFVFDVSATSTLSSGTATVYGANNLVELVEFNDGLNMRSRSSFNELRYRDYLENGELVIPEPDDNATTEAVQYGRQMMVGPQNFAGSDSDFMLPAACLEGGSLTFNFASALSRFSANCTALSSVSIRPYAMVAYLDGEVRIPPYCEWGRTSAGQADVAIPGHSMYTHLAMLDTLATPGTAITAGDFAAVGIDTGRGSIRTQDVQAYERAFTSQMRSGVIPGLRGEPRAATDDNAKKVDRATPTALAAADACVQPIIFSPKGSRITKLRYQAGSQLRLVWTGSQTTAGLIWGRINEQSPEAEAMLAARALDRLKRKMRARNLKLLVKGGDPGDRENYLPHAYKLA